MGARSVTEKSEWQVFDARGRDVTDDFVLKATRRGQFVFGRVGSHGCDGLYSRIQLEGFAATRRGSFNPNCRHFQRSFGSV